MNCNTTILASNDYKLPELHWRFNGELLNSSLPQFMVTTLPNNSQSELRIVGASQRDSGYYECVVFDGYQVLENGEVAYLTIISSKRAILEVVGKYLISCLCVNELLWVWCT